MYKTSRFSNTDFPLPHLVLLASLKTPTARFLRLTTLPGSMQNPPVSIRLAQEYGEQTDRRAQFPLEEMRSLDDSRRLISTLDCSQGQHASGVWALERAGKIYDILISIGEALRYSHLTSLID